MLEKMRDVLIVSLIASFIWFAIYVAVLTRCCVVKLINPLKFLSNAILA